MICKNCEREIVPEYGCLCSFDDSLIKETPKKGELYKHSNGNMYIVVLIANEHSRNAQYPITVIYKGNNERVWAKPLSNFNATMTHIPFKGEEKHGR